MIEFEKLRLNLLCYYCSSIHTRVPLKIKSIDSRSDIRAGHIDTGHDIGRIDKLEYLHKWNTSHDQMVRDSQKQG